MQKVKGDYFYTASNWKYNYEICCWYKIDLDRTWKADYWEIVIYKVHPANALVGKLNQKIKSSENQTKIYS